MAAACPVLRLRSFLLVAVAFLLAMNLLLPVRYTIQLVTVQQNLVPEAAYLERREPALQPPSEAVLAAPTTVGVELAEKELPPGPARIALRQPESGQLVEQEEGEEQDPFLSRKDYPHFLAHEDLETIIKSFPPAPPSLTSERDAAQTTVKYKVALDHLKVKWQDAGFSDYEFKQVFGKMDKGLRHDAMADKADQDRMPGGHYDDSNGHRRKERMEVNDKKEKTGSRQWPSARGVNFNDPVQRMAYYNKVKRKFADSNMTMQQSERAGHMKELINTLWGGWFNNSGCKFVSECIIAVNILT